MKTILSIDGGGMKGYIPCSVLVELEKRTGKSCFDQIDMFAGTSIGGILACLLATGMKATDALNFFTTDGPKIFGHQQTFGHNGIIEPRYAAEPLEKCLQEYLSTLKLSDLKKALLIPAFDLASYQPYFFKAPNLDVDYLLCEVARATSAAQSYFPACKLDEKVLWDGGNVANNPTACAVAEAVRLWPGEKIRILSVGCGQTNSHFPATDLINAGIIKVGVETVSLLFDANDELPDYILRYLLPDGYFRISPKLVKALAIDGASPADLTDLKSAADLCVADASSTLDNFIAFA